MYNLRDECRVLNKVKATKFNWGLQNTRYQNKVSLMALQLVKVRIIKIIKEQIVEYFIRFVFNVIESSPFCPQIEE